MLHLCLILWDYCNIVSAFLNLSKTSLPRFQCRLPFSFTHALSRASFMCVFLSPRCIHVCVCACFSLCICVCGAALFW